LESYVEEIFKVQELREYKENALVPKLKTNLVYAGDRVNKTTDNLVEQLRKFIELKMYLENRRIAEIIKEIEELALAAKNDHPAGSQFVEIDDVPRISIVMDRGLYEPPKNPEINSENLEEGIPSEDSSALFEQLYVNPEILKERIRMLLRGKKQISLKEVTEEVPIEKGLTEVVTYFSIASGMEKENKSIINTEVEETISYQKDGELNEVRLPKTIFLA